jgi:putative transposase
MGFPRFPKKGRDDPFRLTGSIWVLDRAVQLPQPGAIRMKEEPKTHGRILSATMSRETDGGA